MLVEPDTAGTGVHATHPAVKRPWTCPANSEWPYTHKIVTPLRQREGDQPLPVPNGQLSAHTLAQVELEKRRGLGISRYGTQLQAFNGRDALQDLIEELADALCYAVQLRTERDSKENSSGPDMP